MLPHPVARSPPPESEHPGAVVGQLFRWDGGEYWLIEETIVKWNRWIVTQEENKAGEK